MFDWPGREGLTPPPPLLLWSSQDGAHLVRRMPDIRLSPRCPGTWVRYSETGRAYICLLPRYFGKGKLPEGRRSAPVCPDCSEGSVWERRGGVGDGGGPPESSHRQQEAAPVRPSRSKRSVRKPSVQTETKYIELMVVNDNDMVRLSVRTRECRFSLVSSGFPWLQAQTSEGGNELEKVAILRRVFRAVTPAVFVSAVCAAASLQRPNQELCQSRGQHGRRGESCLPGSSPPTPSAAQSPERVCLCVCCRWHLFR